jgi:hypothetical protein
MLTRRQLLTAVGGALAAGALSSLPARAGDNGAAIIRRFAALPDDPWAVCHGVRGMGRDFTLEGGRRAVDWLLETQLETVSVNGQSLLAFPPSIEVHPNMFLKTLLEAGVTLDYRFTLKGSGRVLGEVADAARALFRSDEVTTQANMLPWSIIAFARTTSPLRARWTNAWGKPVDFDLVVESALRLMEEASQPLAQAMREGRAEATKAPVHGFTCGGTHMLYGLLTAVQAGYVGRDRLERVRQQVDVMLWRLNADLELISSFYKERASQRGANWYETDAKLKLLGHGQECLALASRRGVVRLTAAQQGHWREAETRLKRMIEDIEAHNFAETRDLDRELFRQLVGDACHARHGLTFV